MYLGKGLASTELGSVKGKLCQANLISSHRRVTGSVNQQEAIVNKDVKISQA